MKQIRITIPPHIAKAKGWSSKSDLEIFPVLKDASAELTKDTDIVIKEVKNG